jgi:hypothetical protein
VEQEGSITSAADAADLSSPDNLQTHIMYNAGIKVSFGGKKTNLIYNAKLNEQLDIKDKETQVYLDEKIAQNNADNSEKILVLKQEYQNKLEGLETDLEKAKADNDIDKAVVILEQKKTAQNSLEEVNSIEKGYRKEETQQAIATNKETSSKKRKHCPVPAIKTVNDSTTVDILQFLQLK